MTTANQLTDLERNLLRLTDAGVVEFDTKTSFWFIDGASIAAQSMTALDALVAFGMIRCPQGDGRAVSLTGLGEDVIA